MRAGKVPLSPVLRRIKFYFDALIKTSDNYLVIHDMNNKVTLVSANLVEDFDVPSTVFNGFLESWLPLVHASDKDTFVKSVEDVFARQTDLHELEYRVKNRRGEYVWIHACGSVACNTDGQPFMFVGRMSRMGRRSQADDVTGLLNKYQFEKGIKEALNEYRKTSEGGAVLIVGIDNFKTVNETYNRIFGNQVLKMISEQIKNILPPEIRLYRLDGDEFGIVYPGVDEEGVSKLFYDLQNCMIRVQEVNSKKFFCTISAGTVFYPQGGKDLWVLQKHAEAALDMAKRDGKNRNCIFSRDQYNRWVRILTMREHLKTSVDNNCEGFMLVYQPQVDTVTKQVIGCEALLRWYNPQGKMVSPMDFVPVLEESKMIVPVGRWIVAEGVRVCKEWQKIMPGFKMSINVSYEQMKDGNFVNYVLEVLEREQLESKYITLELTESSIVADWEFLHKQFNVFRSHGLLIAMDDFGTGYSSLAYLKNLACDIVKIDREFVKNILDNEFDRRLVEYVVDLCHFLGMKTCIEGVERDEEFDLLGQVCQADYIQGYLFGRPETKEDFEAKFLVKK